jgi:integrase
MAPVDLPYLQLYRSGARLFAYYRRAGSRRRLTGDDGKPIDPQDRPALLAAWQRAHHAHEAADRQAAAAADARAVRPRSMADLIARYRKSEDYESLAEETRRDYEKGLKPLERDFGDRLVEGLRRHHVKQIRDRYARRVLTDKAGRPVLDASGKEQRVPNVRQANRVITTLSILMTFAGGTLGWREDNPALRPKRLRSSGDGYRPWAREEFSTFWQASDEEWRFAALLALLTGQRGQDQVAMTEAHYDGTGIAVVPEKRQGQLRMWVPVHPVLKRVLDERLKSRRRRRAEEGHSTAVEAVTLLRRPDGQAWETNAFQKAAGKAIRAAGLRGLVWHGLRGTAASWAADGGASDAQLMAMMGWTTSQMAQRYRRGAEQKRLASGAVAAIKLTLPRKRRKNASGTPSV